MIDSHCHLTDERFADDLDAVLRRAWDADLEAIICVASDAADAAAALDIAAAEPRVHATAGLHPHNADRAGPGELDRLAELLVRPDVVAVGETGLDFHYDNSPRPTQRRLFEWHLQRAADTGLPAIVHSRSADDDTAAMIRAAAGVRGILHCFTGAAALLDAGLDAGWFVSFGGIVTFRNFAGADLLRAVPADRLLIETDSPYLAPIPHRGQRNEPAFLAETCRVVAQLRGDDADELGAVTAANARACYRLGPAPAGP
jgi:TatD DNase family protein